MYVGTNDVSQLIFDQDKWILSNSNKIIKATTAVDDVPYVDQIRIFPNPASQFIEISNPESIAGVEFVSTSGVSLSRKIQHGRVFIADLPSGYYTVVLRDREKGVVCVTSLLIQ